MLPDHLQCLSVSDRVSFMEFGFGDTVVPPFQCVHHAFVSHAASSPVNIAVEDFAENITYAELDQKSTCLSVRLRSLGVGRHSRVCLLVERSIPMVIGILGVIKAGAAYVPLDGNVVSDSTLHHVLHDSSATAILAFRKFASRLESSAVPAIYLDDFKCECLVTSECKNHFNDLSVAEDSVYSSRLLGTTGVPKGVDVKHGNVTNLVCLAPGNLSMAPGVRVSQLMNIGFDMAAWEILGSLCNGATLCLRGKTSKEWRAVMKTVDVVIATPSMLSPHQPSAYPNIKVVAVAGEACPQGLADEWAKTVRFYNCCGPTEITIVNTMQLHCSGEALSIGQPTPNNNVYVLGDDLQPLPIGQTGLMWAGGKGISRGYLNLPQKTDERYLFDLFVNDGSLMFNTGDLGRWRPDGTLEHLGRIDDQVKVKGFRVELDGVAAALESSPGVKIAAALLIDDILWGFVAPNEVDSETVLSDAAKIQPYYAVPTRLTVMKEFPKTSNMKTDKRALRQLALDEIAKEKTSAKISEKAEAGPAPVEKWLDIPSLPPPAYIRNAGVSPTSTSSSGSSIKEKPLALEGPHEPLVPNKTQGHLLRNIRHQIFSLYRRLFGIVFVVNMVIFIITCVRGASVVKLGEIVVANLLCAVLMRQDYVINAFFTVCCSVPTSWPLAIRRRVAEVYHIGGFHSSCAISGVIWLLLFTGKATQSLLNGGLVSPATLAVTYWILTLLVGIVIFAYPTFRSRRHNTFERLHRFLGWTATALVWCQVVLLTNDFKEPEQSLGLALSRSPAFWLLSVLTGSIILPWLRLRRVPVRSVVLSDHAVRLYFDYVTTKPGHFTRISDNPLMEWHGFATINEPGKSGYSLVVSKAGDWTAKQIHNPPTHLWVRGVPAYGVLRIASLFRRIVLVATGSGIGPCAPVILAKKVPLCLLWTSPDVRKTFGDHLVDSILEAAPKAVLHDTRRDGKPDMIQLTYRLYKEFNAEAVCVISNQKLTRKIVYGMKSRGIPAFGAIWDS
ncbi:nonribosomal peptide synthetase 12 [Lentinula edodes]|uniref:nonribosomal peptide synthetase 12 n=1 Tax=Lentinula edodes TaxID=5353 RepID=UPI001E8D0400|nr:nonribosomal peptide synthetase 12 [Lentinula edodes]KAH7878038.1 nonribosomal peptide synthetase 12 [Lentinula edodes]